MSRNISTNTAEVESDTVSLKEEKKTLVDCVWFHLLERWHSLHNNTICMIECAEVECVYVCMR